MFPLAARVRRDPGNLVEVILGILAAMIHQEILLLVDEIQDLRFAEFEVRGELDGRSGTGFLAETAIDAPGEIESAGGNLNGKRNCQGRGTERFVCSDRRLSRERSRDSPERG